MRIFYCEKCHVRVADDEIASGEATSEEDDRVFCAKCSKALLKGGAQLQETPARNRSIGVAKPSARIPNSAPTRHSAANLRLALIAAGLGVGVFALALISNAQGKHTTQVDPPDAGASSQTISSTTQNAPRPVADQPPPPPNADTSWEQRLNAHAQELLDETRKWSQEHPDDRWKYRDKLAQLATAYGSTPAGKEAAQLMTQVKAPDSDGQWKKAIDLLAMINPTKDAVAGKWNIQNGELKSDSSFIARIEIPYRPPEEYDFRIVFTRVNGNQDVAQILTQSGKPFMWNIGQNKNRVAKFEGIQTKSADVSRDSWIENGHTYTSIVQVRKNNVRAFMDGKLIYEAETDFTNASLRPQWQLRDSNLLGVGCHYGETVFKQIDLIELSGSGKFTRNLPPKSTPN